MYWLETSWLENPVSSLSKHGMHLPPSRCYVINKSLGSSSAEPSSEDHWEGRELEPSCQYTPHDSLQISNIIFTIRYCFLNNLLLQRTNRLQKHPCNGKLYN